MADVLLVRIGFARPYACCLWMMTSPYPSWTEFLSSESRRCGPPKRGICRHIFDIRKKKSEVNGGVECTRTFVEFR